MNTAARISRRITQLAVGRHLPDRTVRVRLTLMYGGLFLLSGAALMAIAYALLVNAGFALEDSYQAQRQFVANASHELRAQLTRLRALSEVALASSEANFASLRTRAGG